MALDLLADPVALSAGVLRLPASVLELAGPCPGGLHRPRREPPDLGRHFRQNLVST